MYSDATIQGKDGDEYVVRLLTKNLAKEHADELVRVHNIIPYVAWSAGDLMAAASPKGVYYSHKWQLSFAIFYGDKAIGLLVAYRRDASEAHPVEAIYVHRLAVEPAYQGQGIGTQLLRYALQYYAREFPHIETYTVQTNDEAANEQVIKFYQEAGFERFQPVQYPEKLDILLKMHKADIAMPAVLSS